MNIKGLQARGIKVAPPASNSQLLKLKEVINLELFDTLYKYVYQWFDGFDDGDFDSASFLRIWPIERIISSRQLSRHFAPFLDFSLDSEIYGLLPGQAPKIYSYHTMRPASVDINDLIIGIVDGRFDSALGI